MVVTPDVTVTVVPLEPAGTVAEPGTVSSGPLLLRVTPKPPVGAAFVRPTVQVVDAAGSMLDGQESEDNCAGALTVREAVREIPLDVAVNTAVTSVVTVAAVAVKVALDDPEESVTDVGTVTLALLLDSVTFKIGRAHV